MAWRSDALWRGLGRAFCLSREQLEEYLDGRLVLEQALSSARKIAERAKAEQQDERAIEAAAREAIALAALEEDELAPAIQIFLRRYMRKHGNRPAPAKRLAARALAVHAELLDITEQVAPKAVSESHRVRRSKS